MLDPGVRGTTKQGGSRSLRIYPAGERQLPTGERPEHNIIFFFNILVEKTEETQQRGCKLQIIEERTLLASQSPEYNCKRKKSIIGSTNLPSTDEVSALST